MSHHVDSSQSSEQYLKQRYPDFVSKLEKEGLSFKTICKLIEEEEITTMAGLKHLGADTIDAMQIPATHKNILRKMVEDLKTSSVTAQGGIEAKNCTMKIGKVDGKAALASIRGAGKGAGIKMEDVKMETGDIGKDGTVESCVVDKGGEK